MTSESLSVVSGILLGFLKTLVHNMRISFYSPHRFRKDVIENAREEKNGEHDFFAWSVVEQEDQEEAL